MKIFAISDLHLCLSGDKPMDIFGSVWDNYLEEIKKDWQSKVNEEDVVLLAGDLSWAMKLENATKDIEFLNSLKGTKILIRGNHDYWWKSLSNLKENLPSNIIPLQNNAVKIENFIFCGTRGWTVAEKNPLSQEDKKIFDREIIRLELSLKNVNSLKQEDDKVVALIHFPPFNSMRDDSGFTALFEKYGVDSVIYGHLHGKNVRAEIQIIKNGINYYLTSCDLVNNKLIQIY